MYVLDVIRKDYPDARVLKIYEVLSPKGWERINLNCHHMTDSQMDKVVFNFGEQGITKVNFCIEDKHGSSRCPDFAIADFQKAKNVSLMGGE